MCGNQKTAHCDNMMLVTHTCRYCGNQVDELQATTTHSYWEGLPFVCHKSCKDAGMKQEAFDCQIIDADCNDCRHYKRGRLSPKTVSTWINEHGKLATVIHTPDVFIGGQCLKFNRPVMAQPKKWSGLECFEHRRTPLPPRI